MARQPWFALILCTACSGRGPLERWTPPSPPARLCQDPTLSDDDFCLPDARILSLLQQGTFSLLAARRTSRGVSGARQLVVHARGWAAPQGLVFRVKWKPASTDGEQFNNSPRRQLAAYRLQKLFLAQDELVVPPTAVRCIPIDVHRHLIGKADPLTGTTCVLGTVSYWVDGVTDRGVWNPTRFWTDRAYRRNIANLNVFFMLSDHADHRTGNVLLATDPHRPRVFTVDNDVSFSGFENLVANAWDDLQVPAIPRRTVEALRQLSHDELVRNLAVLEELVILDGMLVPVTPGPPIDLRKGVRHLDDRVQLGLKQDEIDKIHRRIRRLLERVDKGEIAVF